MLPKYGIMPILQVSMLILVAITAHLSASAVTRLLGRWVEALLSLTFGI